MANPSRYSPLTKLPIQLPIIDISNTRPETGKAMIDAATKYGFLYVDSVTSDFSDEDVESAFAMARKFFASPHEEKVQVKIGSNNRGWTGMHVETLDPNHQKRGDFKEAFNFGEFKNDKAQQPLPSSLVPHEAEISRFMNLCRKTCDRILTLLALGLGIPSDWFTTRHDSSKGPSGVTFRFLYYPSIQSPSTSTFQQNIDVRAGAHSDYGSITLLFQRDGQPGLEIQTPTGGWAPVPIRPQQESTTTSFPPILVNIGDLLSYWTNGLLKSTVHRVVFPVEQQSGSSHGDDRYSMAYFCHPLDDTELVPVPSKLVEQHRDAIAGYGPNADKIMTARDHLASRLAATYGGNPNEYK
ncbi:oxidoreductase [Coccidioides immitis RS]|uniref:Oxidoreductase n=2 Tax=Coccidioides immitis (strain RS) TaxID=246410 RepID=A0A0D8JVL5_COCIM|nr:oxidoreductase [Coccidioides immitis RS]KJF61352.1 oxidoreductase [Coccidioides immitis RS]TPX20708.1 hypothetical protein DIZ76_016603 [Coccidioides immitis]